jgi:hypothetical protein
LRGDLDTIAGYIKCAGVGIGSWGSEDGLPSPLRSPTLPDIGDDRCIIIFDSGGWAAYRDVTDNVASRICYWAIVVARAKCERGRSKLDAVLNPYRCGNRLKRSGIVVVLVPVGYRRAADIEAYIATLVRYVDGTAPGNLLDQSTDVPTA